MMPYSDLKAAVAALQSKNEAGAIAMLKGLSGRLPQIADYVAWFRASAEFKFTGNYADVLAACWHRYGRNRLPRR